jgi:Fe-S cluster assembly protein SufD
VGPLNEAALFYLMSRGLPRLVAERLLLQGFFHPFSQRLGWSGMQEKLHRAILLKMKQREGQDAS